MTLAARIALTATRPRCASACSQMQPYACRLRVNVFKHPPMVRSAAALPNNYIKQDTTNEQLMQETVKHTNMQKHNTVKKTIGNRR